MAKRKAVIPNAESTPAKKGPLTKEEAFELVKRGLMDPDFYEVRYEHLEDKEK